MSHPHRPLIDSRDDEHRPAWFSASQAHPGRSGAVDHDQPRQSKAEETRIEQFSNLEHSAASDELRIARSAGTTPAASRSASLNVSSASVPERTLFQKSPRSLAPGSGPQDRQQRRRATGTYPQMKVQPWTCLSPSLRAQHRRTARAHYS